MQNLLVTGGCGFIGSDFIRYLLEASDFNGRIINVDKLTYAGNPENLAAVSEKYPGRYVFVHADVCDRAKMDRVFETHAIDGVCHFAAESHVDRSISSPDAFMRSNITGTYTMLERVRRHGPDRIRFHHVSTDEVYGSLGSSGYFTEDSVYRPNSPYAASKAASDHLVRAYAHTYGLRATVSNCSNNYGPYQFPEKLIPLIILNAHAGKSLPVYGDGKNIRDWLYVRDQCRAVWTIMQRGRVGEAYNIGGCCEMENLQVVQMICRLLDARQARPGLPPRTDLIAFVRDRPGHDRRYAIDCSKLTAETGWEPEESFESGLEKTITWYLQNAPWVQRVVSGEYRHWIAHQYGANSP